jgi:hypothetical protein
MYCKCHLSIFSKKKTTKLSKFPQQYFIFKFNVKIKTHLSQNVFVSHPKGLFVWCHGILDIKGEIAVDSSNVCILQHHPSYFDLSSDN